MADNFLAHNLTVGADNQFVEANELVAEPKSLGDVMNNLAIRIIRKTLQEIDKEGLEDSAVLRQTVSMPIELFGQTFVAELIMADYYDYINQGVQGKGGDKNKYEWVTSKKGKRYRRVVKDSSGNPVKIPWKVKAIGSDYSFKNKKPPLLFGWADRHGMNPYALQQVIYHSGIRPRHYFDRVLEDINNGEIKRKFIMELNKAGGEAIVKGMKDIITRKWQ